MDSKILLGKILQRFCDLKLSRVEGYNSFGYIKETNTTVTISREEGQDTPVPFAKLIVAIEAYQNMPHLYNEGPTALRDFGITHITSPVWSLLHLLTEEDYK